MIYAAPSTLVEIVADGFTTGLTGTIGYRVRDNQGADIIVRTTVGIAEDIAGSGIYRAQFTAPAPQGQYTVVWDSGGGSPLYATEDLVVTTTTTVSVLSATIGPFTGYFSATELVLPAHASIGASTVPMNYGNVASMIVEVDAELNAAAAAAGYLVPVVAPPSGPTIGFAQMVSYAKKGVAARVLGNFFPKLPGPGAQSSIVDEYRKEYLAALDSIRNGDTPLVGVPHDASGAGRELPRSYSTSNSTATSGVVSQMTVGKEF